MKTLYDVQQLLMRFGNYVYFGDREVELEFMADELKEMYTSGIIDWTEWSNAMTILQMELAKLNRKTM
ncbi:YqgQ family protein [Bacillus pumilus]|uniref:YqgQ family protein n=1 Tax=Bacillus pumilus TaxID=1408 RepID=UPI001C20F786|nr:YqgQ family protein [Bacillus pumilus]MBU8697942.1 YqgQ family protein [Bacillus pumilus]MCY9671471.1 YqgQ family protein [Bacillus pumilus]